jgi:hypothetical protein
MATEEKVRILRQREKLTYREQMSPRKEPAHVAAFMTDWQQFKAKEFRYVKTGTSFYKNVYLPASTDARLAILNDLERTGHEIASHSTIESGSIGTAADHLPAPKTRDLDGIRCWTEMLLGGDWRLDVRTLEAGVTVGSPLRWTDTRGDDSVAIVGGALSESDELSYDSLASEECVGEFQIRIVQSSSVIERALADLRERDERSAFKDQFDEIDKCLDCDLFLTNLKVSHGLNPSLYRVVTAIDGTVRIQCGSRSLTPAEFLTVELGLPLKEAAPILQLTHERQVNSKARIQSGKDFAAAIGQGTADTPMCDVVTGLNKAGGYDHQNVKLIVTREKLAVDDGLSGKAVTKIVGAAYKSDTKKSSRRGSDYGI